MVRRRRQSGYTLVEIVTVLALFGAFIIIIAILSAEMHRMEKRFPINYMLHPDAAAVVARLRRDVYDSTSYPSTFPPGVNTYEQSPTMLILDCVRQDGTTEYVVYDFGKKGEAHRLTFSAPSASAQTGDWVARSVPQFSLDAETMPNGQVGTRLFAVDPKGKVAIDEIFVPRPHGGTGGGGGADAS